MPSTDEEVWRYSRIDELELDAFPRAARRDAPSCPTLATGFVAAVPSATVVATVDGQPSSHGRRDGRARARGRRPRIRRAAEEGVLGSVAGDGPDVFATLNDAFAPRRCSSACRARRGDRAAGRDRAPRNRLRRRRRFPGWWSTSAPTRRSRSSRCSCPMRAPALVAPLTELAVGQCRRAATYVGLQQLALDTWQVGSLVVTVDQGATFRSVAARLRRRLRAPAHRLPPHRPRRARRPRRRLLRRGHPDARLPHVPGAHRARHHEQPAVQGRGRRAAAAASTRA